MLETIESLEGKQKEMRKSGTAYVAPEGLSEYQNTASRLTTEEMRLDDMNNRLVTSFASVKEKVRECGGVVDEVGNKAPALQKLQNALEKLSPKLVQNGMKQLKSSMKSLIRTVETEHEASETVSKFHCRRYPEDILRYLQHPQVGQQEHFVAWYDD